MLTLRSKFYDIIAPIERIYVSDMITKLSRSTYDNIRQYVMNYNKDGQPKKKRLKVPKYTYNVNDILKLSSGTQHRDKKYRNHHHHHMNGGNHRRRIE